MGWEVGGPGPGRDLSMATTCVLTVTQMGRRHRRWPEGRGQGWSHKVLEDTQTLAR